MAGALTSRADIISCRGWLQEFSRASIRTTSISTLRYRFAWKKVQPYAEAKIGANYAREYQLFSTYGAYDSQWGFYISPEIGVVFHPFNKSNIGLQLSGYYSYATNRSEAFGLDGINNAGFKLGLSF